MIFLRKMRGISEMHLYVQITRICKKVFTKQRNILKCFSGNHIHKLFEMFGFDGIFGRSAVMELLELKGSGASKFLSNLIQADIIEPVSGHGKGKYKFKKV